MALSLRRTIDDPIDEATARASQLELSRSFRPGTQFKNVCGVSLAYERGEGKAHVAAMVLSARTWSVVHSQQAAFDVRRPREPDFENFREAPLILEVLLRLAIEPDVIFVDGHGMAHPRKFGVASHVGLALDHPTVGISDLWPSGCAGSAARFPPPGGLAPRGTRVALRLAHNGDVVGHEIFTRPEEPPIYASPGHRVDLDEAWELALRASPWHRVPEPLHAARVASQKARDSVDKG